MSKISVLIKEPGGKPRHVNIENTLKNLQRTVGGYIETVSLTSSFGKHLVIICNEEGKLLGLEPNVMLFGELFVGTIIIAGVKDDEFCDLPYGWKDMKLLFPELWEAE